VYAGEKGKSHVSGALTPTVATKQSDNLKLAGKSAGEKAE